jgi:hypothetical protein
MGYVPNLRLVVPGASEMTAREEKAATVRALREEGLPWREIGERLGIALSYAHGLYTDPTGERDRERKRRYERPCVDCGKTINPNGIAEDVVRCRDCWIAHGQAQTRQWVIDSVAEWVRLFGAPPAATDWNLAHARAIGAKWKVSRAESTGRRWPPPQTVINHFGSWNGMLRELGHRPLEPSEYALGRRGVALRDEDRA